MTTYCKNDIPEELQKYFKPAELGLEPTFTEYIDKLCNIFDEVKRVLKPTGTCWVNLGDTYNANWRGGKGETASTKQQSNKGTLDFMASTGTADKCLLQIPSRLAIEMCNRGWILRNKIIWHKPNCMPSSVKDRFTVDYEEVFFFVKSKKYYFEQQMEPMITADISTPRGSEGALTPNSGRRFPPIGGIKKAGGVSRTYSGNQPEINSCYMRNKRSVWSISTKPYKEAHFATYPETLIEPMIKAGCPVGGVVLDPFGGSGTTAQVAIKQGKQYVLIELNPEYIPLIQKRIDNTMFQMKLGGI